MYMDRMDSIVATQWVDFTESISPQIPMQDYFEKKHAIHEPITEFNDSSTENAECVSTDLCVTDLCVNKEAQQDLDLIKSTPVRVISPRYRKGTTKTEQVTYDQVLTDAMRTLELYKKPLKARSALNKTIQEPKTFKTPSTSITKSSRSVGYRSVPNKLVQSSTARRSVKSDKNASTSEKTDNIIIYTTEESASSLLNYDQADAKDNILVKTDDYKEDNKIQEEHTEEYEEQNEEEHKALHGSEELMNDDNKEEQSDVNVIIEKNIREQGHKPRASVLTWQNGRRSLNKRRGSNRFISLAEAVSRFQNDTPKRFRTKCNKDRVGALQNASSKSLVQHHRLKPTIPISPALMSKNRTRAVTVLSQEEREKQQMEEMRKHPIKANPIPPSVLRGPVHPVIKPITRKLAITAENSSSAMQQSEKTVTNVSARLNPGTSHHEKTTAKKTVTKVLVTDPTGIIVKREEIPYFGVPNNTAKSVTRVVPFSFEARNKNLQMKKEQRLKTLQEADKVKLEFHARPVPNFSKSAMSPSVAKQQKDKRKTIAQPCPFSFEQRDKNWFKKKDELVKQVLEEDKRMRMFRANPAPVFKPVRVRGLSKERLSVKEEKEHAVEKCDDQENEEPNIVSMRKTKKIAGIVVDKQVRPRELNTDKRAKERREFDEKMKRKEMEEETKRQEAKRRQEEDEKQMKAEQRKQAEVKARPMPTYKPLIIAKATKPLTEPQSPALNNKYRSKKS